MSDDTTETIATYQHDSATYEVDHLGILQDSQWGEFAVYRDGRHVASFAIAESMLKPEYRPAELPLARSELVALAIAAVAEEEGGQDTTREQDQSIAAFMATQDARMTAGPGLS